MTQTPPISAASVNLRVGEQVYALDFDSYTTLCAHGIIYKDADGYRLGTEEELTADPGSAGVNHPAPGAVLGIVLAALNSTSHRPETESELRWRDLALQFDAHRMEAMGLLRMIVRNIEEYATVRDILREPLQSLKVFLASPPLSGEKVLANRLAALTAAASIPASRGVERVTVQPWETRPTGDDAMEPSEIDVHEGAWAVIIGTNAKPAGWIDTHELFVHQLYRDQILPTEAVCAWPNCTCAPLAKCPSAAASNAPQPVQEQELPTTADIIEALSSGVRFLSRTALQGSQEVKDFDALGDRILANEGDVHMINMFAPIAALRLAALSRAASPPEQELTAKVERLETERDEAQGIAQTLLAAAEAELLLMQDTAATVLSMKARIEASEAKVERLTEALRNIAEGNLGDASWQANYRKIAEVARAALGDTP